MPWTLAEILVVLFFVYAFWGALFFQLVLSTGLARGLYGPNFAAMPDPDDPLGQTRLSLLVSWAPRQYHDVAVFDDRLWVLEGYAKGNRNDVWHSADGVTWHEVPKTPWRPRHAASVFVHDGALWMVAGNNMESDVWRLTRKKS